MTALGAAERRNLCFLQLARALLPSGGRVVASPRRSGRYLSGHAPLLSAPLPSAPPRRDEPHFGVLSGRRTREDRSVASRGVLHVESSPPGRSRPARRAPQLPAGATSDDG